MLSTRNLFIILFFILSGCKGRNSNETISKDPNQLYLSKIKLTELSGKPVEMEQYKGKTVFMNFWATWCVPCREEMPSIRDAMEELKEKNIVFLFVSDEDREDIKKFRAANSYKFNFVKGENVDELNITVLPTTFIFNPDGKLVFSEAGYRKWDDEKNINLILNSGK